MSNYNHIEIEKKWQNFWETNKTFSVENKKSDKKFYALDMFPFPSGAGLHVGHPEGYTATDILCRKRRMEGFDVLHPMGWDAFGLPAENFAIKSKIHPEISTNKNIENFTRQIKSLGFSYDWDREISTTDTDYYKWTQDLFLKFYEKGLLYEDNKPMNWCPSCKVVCANEEVEQGMHERCGNAVEKKALKQWMFKITDYAERLLQDLETPNVIVLHGLGGNGNEGWGADMKKFFTEKNISCEVPTFPNADTPEYSEWKAFFEKNIVSKITPQTVIFTHSLGGGFMQKYLTEENLPIKFSELVLVAPTINDCKIPEISNFFTEKFDYQKISEAVENIFIYAGGKDPYISAKEFEILAEKLSAQFIFDENQEHYWSGDALSKYPELSGKCEKIEAGTLDWPHKIKAMQSNWIGKSEGLLFTSPLIVEENHSLEISEVQTFSTHFEAFKADMFFVIAPDHPLLEDLTNGVKNQSEILKECKNIVARRDARGFEEEKESEGIFTGRYIQDPVGNGKLPLWVASFALADYGTGIVKCSCHDERDFAFAKKYGIKMKPVLFPENPEEAEKVKNLEYCFSDMKNGILTEPAEFSGKKAGDLREEIMQYAEAKKLAKRETNYRLRDWIFTRQRYWGEPIPLVFDEAGKCYALDESELPVVLPDTPNYAPSASGESPLAKIDDWVNVQGYITESGKVKLISDASNDSDAEPVEAEANIQKFTRETSTMPNWAGSSWYWLRFMDAKNENQAWSPEAEKQWGAVDLYVGGAEHAVLHLLYARFWHKALYDMGLVSTKEPFKKLVNQGMILSYAFEKHTAGGGLVAVDEVQEIPENSGEYFWKNPETGENQEVKKITAKMSKSLKNVVNPDDIVHEFGADTLRMYEMFMGPFEQSKEWNTKAVEGMHRFLAKIHRYFSEKPLADACPNEELIRLTHKTVKKVSEDIEAFKFNTAISQMMVWMNEFSKLDVVPKIAGGRFIRLLSPFAPHLAEELWKKFKPDTSTPLSDQTITFEKWPSFKEELTVDSEMTYGVQVNGKVRGELTISKEAGKDECLSKAKELEKVQKFLSEGIIRKEIFVPGKIIGFVVK